MGGAHFAVVIALRGVASVWRQVGRRPFAAASTDAPVAGDGGSANELLEAGYALAGSTRPRNGNALREGVEADENLYRFVRDTVGAPERTYVWGESLGGVVAELLTEREDWVDGALQCAG
ncbi:hypothetical protein [Cryptosporangium sp. NPDC048952]|uniref:hypothetical protein n=1 Tax=Cryptosporangium sp. NPDC048952 TaxID=3363961 RepID=UPI003724880C